MLKWVTLLFLFFIIIIILLANTDGLQFLQHIHQIPYADKAGHFILFGLLSFLLNRTALVRFPRLNPAFLILIVSLLLSFLIGLEELSQSFFPSRTMSLADLFASYAGVGYFALLAYLTKS